MTPPPTPQLPEELGALDEAFAAAERDARALVDGVSDARGAWRPDAGSWSVAECLDHLAVGNRVYVAAMRPAADRARQDGRARRRPARPGVIGRWFVQMLEPPVKTRMKAPRKIRPRPSPPLLDAAAAFFASHAEVRAFLRAYADIDLAGVRFANPFIRGVRFSLATGLHALAAHERRHLLQAWGVRRAAEQSEAASQE
jgi:DinB superfamily